MQPLARESLFPSAHSFPVPRGDRLYVTALADAARQSPALKAAGSTLSTLLNQLMSTLTGTCVPWQEGGTEPSGTQFSGAGRGKSWEEEMKLLHENRLSRSLPSRGASVLLLPLPHPCSPELSWVPVRPRCSGPCTARALTLDPQPWLLGDSTVLP